MENFPNTLTPNNLVNFKTFNKNHQLCYLRKYIFEKMLSDDFKIPDKCFIDLQKLDIGNLGEINYKIDEQIVIQIQNELENLGWCTSTAYGGTILFIYTKEQVPIEIVNAKLFD